MRSIKSKILTAAFVLIGSAAAANAQMSGPLGVKFRTSFPFMVGNTTMPAGNYAVRQLGSRDSRFSLILQGPGGQVMLNTVAGSSKAPFLRRTEVIFEKIDDQYFLSEVRSAGAEAGNRIPMASRQRTLLARGRPVREIVVTTGL
jgi:hypothetical protein